MNEKIKNLLSAGDEKRRQWELAAALDDSSTVVLLQELRVLEYQALCLMQRALLNTALSTLGGKS